MPVLTSAEPWTAEQKDESVARGCHLSAKKHADFLREEMASNIENKFWMVLPYALVRDLIQLMLSPAAVKEERDRRPRLLCDHSWDFGWPSINETTLPHAPPEAMQFGQALPRILYQIRHANPRFGPVRLAKHDVKDGFYRLFLDPLDCLRMSIIMPEYPGEPQLIGIPMACTMGWVQSPPTFCSMSETVCDLANGYAGNLSRFGTPHRLDSIPEELDDYDRSMTPRPREPDQREGDLALLDVPRLLDRDQDGYLSDSSSPDCNDLPDTPEPGASTPGTRGPGAANEEPPAPPSNRRFTKPVGSTDVFVDDFIQVGQGGPRRMKALRRSLWHAVDEVLAKPDEASTERPEAISLKKLARGDGSWCTRKEILGWIVDTLRQTLELPGHRKKELAELLDRLCKARRMSTKRYQKALGKLRFVAAAIPGAQGLFGALQLALNQASGDRIPVSRNLKDHLYAFARLAADLSRRPTHLAEIVPQDPSYLGATDAAKAGMGGVYYDGEGNPYVWRYPFPSKVQAALVSEDNPTGTVTNSDLEHTGMLAQVALIADRHPVQYTTIATFVDNTPADSRVRKKAVSSTGPAAKQCIFAAEHQRQHRYCHVSQYLPGEANVMADDASRLQHLTDSAFLSHFNSQYPQHKPWQLLQPPPESTSKLISNLLSPSRAKPTPLATATHKPPPSATGSSSATSSLSPAPSVSSWATRNLGSATSSCTESATDATAAKTTLSQLVQYLKPLRPSARGYKTWVNRIHATTYEQESSIPYTLLSPRSSKTMTTHQAAPTPSTSPSCAHYQTFLTPNTMSMAASTPMSSTSSLWPSSGSCGQANTATRPTKTRRLNPSSSSTSTST